MGALGGATHRLGRCPITVPALVLSPSLFIILGFIRGAHADRRGRERLRVRRKHTHTRQTDPRMFGPNLGIPFLQPSLKRNLFQ